MTGKELREELAFAKQLLAVKRINHELDMKALAGERHAHEHVTITHGHDCKYCGESWNCREDCGQRPGPVLYHGCPEQQAHAKGIAIMLDRQARNLDSPYVSRHLDKHGKPVKVEAAQTHLKAELLAVQEELARVRAEIAAKK